MSGNNQCVNCGRELIERHGIKLCLNCNSDDLKTASIFIDEDTPKDSVFIECLGATLYEPGTNNVIAGVKFLDDEDPFKGWKIIGSPIYAPTHRHRRLIKREALGRIRRCEGCQDYTVRMRRKEGPDFFIPSVKNPKRTKLKTIKHVYSEPI